MQPESGCSPASDIHAARDGCSPASDIQPGTDTAKVGYSQASVIVMRPLYVTAALLRGSVMRR